MKLLQIAAILVLVLFSQTINAQHHQEENHESNNDGRDFRIAGIIGHTLVNNEEIERVNPLIFTVDALYQFGGGFVVTLGPGIELEKKNLFICYLTSS